MSRPGGCPSTGASKFSKARPIILKVYPKSVPSLKHRITAQLSSLRKKMTKLSLSNASKDLITSKISKLTSLLCSVSSVTISQNHIFKENINHVRKMFLQKMVAVPIYNTRD